MMIYSNGDGARCFRCGWEWVLRKMGRPLQCPKCKSPKWDEPKEGKQVEVVHGDVRRHADVLREEGVKVDDGFDFGA